MKAILSIIAASLILPLAAQEMQRPPRPRAAPSPGNVSAGEEGGLGHNIAIRLQGTTTTGSEIDLELTGSGPAFTAQQMVGKEESVLSCEYRVTEADGGYRVSYSIGMQVKVVISSSQGESRNYEYRNVTINGSALCAAGKPVVIVRNGGKPLELVVSPAGEAVERKPVAPPEPVEER
jgi:hypothetical protein